MKSVSRYSYSLGFLVCLLLLGIAFYLQYFADQWPCLLCELQRFILALMGIVFLIAAIHHPKTKSRFIYFILLFLLGMIGLFLASRQLWLIAHPDTLAPGQCSANFAYLIRVLPLHKVLMLSLQGNADCAKETGRFLLLSLPAWSLISFGVLTGLNVVAVVKK